MKIQGKMSLGFETVVGLRQDDALSTLLFNLCVEEVIKNEKTNPGGAIFDKTSQCLLLYADDVVVLGHTVKHVAETIEEVTTVATHIGLTINVSKTKYMYMINRNKRGTEREEIEINGGRYENVEMFKYLGSLITNTNIVSAEIKENYCW